MMASDPGDAAHRDRGGAGASTNPCFTRRGGLERRRAGLRAVARQTLPCSSNSDDQPRCQLYVVMPVSAKLYFVWKRASTGRPTGKRSFQSKCGRAARAARLAVVPGNGFSRRRGRRPAAAAGPVTLQPETVAMFFFGGAGFKTAAKARRPAGRRRRFPRVRGRNPAAKAGADNPAAGAPRGL
jgi:hypothetical protein